MHPAHREHAEQASRAVRAAEKFAAALGSVRFITGQTLAITVWIALNLTGLVRHWDPYPFILLNLAFSTQAAYAAPLILLAQNRQSQVDRAQAALDYRHGADSLALLHAIHTQLHGPGCRCWDNPEGET